MNEMLRTGLHKCIRQYAMEIHMPTPLYNQQSMDRSNDIFNILITLEKSGYRLYETVDNVRSLQYYHPEQNQLTLKKQQFNGEWVVALWETHFINTDVTGTCRKYLH